MDRILAVIPVHNRREMTLAILGQLQTVKRTGFHLDVLVIDDGSSDGTSMMVTKRFPEVFLVRGDGNLWWGGALNVGFRYALDHGYDYIYTLNNDIVLHEDTLEQLHQTAGRLPNTVCGSIVLDENDRILGAGYTFDGFLHKHRCHNKSKSYESVSQDFLPCETLSTESTLIPAGVLKQGLFIDNKRFPHNYSDLDFFDLVRRKGFKLVIVRGSVIHARESSSNYHLFIANKNTQEILKSFFDIKYAFNLNTQKNIAFRDANSITGTIRFIYFMLPYVLWFALKLLLPRETLRRVLVSSKRIVAEPTGKSREQSTSRSIALQ